jgi:WD40 repeat protein
VRVKTERTGKIFNLSKPLSKGGEGTIYEVPRHPNLLAKVYHRDKRNPERFRKLQIMVAYPPDNPTDNLGHPSIAWPIELLREITSNQLVGFVMPRVHQSLRLSEVYNPRARREKIPLFNYRYLVRTARNLCAAVQAVHQADYVIGDLNESNVLVSDRALVTLVDADSFQVRDPQTGGVYRSLVGRHEYTPPELQGCSFTDVDRCPEHDAFALAILIFRLLMEGFHPFDGKYQSKGEPPTIVERIRKGYFPYANSYSIIVPPPPAPPFEMLHPDIQVLFLRCFDDGHRNRSVRPRVDDWLRALKAAEDELCQCDQNPQHYYWRHLQNCPWCKRREKLRGCDPFPSNQTVSPSLSSNRNNLSTNRQLIIRGRYGFKCIAFSPDGLLLASGGVDKNIKLWRVSNRTEVHTISGHNERVNSVSFSPDGLLLASGSSDNTIRIWHVPDATCVKIITGHSASVNSVAFSPVASSQDGYLLASGSSDKTVRLWRVFDGAEVATLTEHTGRVNSVAFSPDGKLLATGSSDNTIKLWYVADGSERATLRGHTERVNSVVFSPDGELLASGSSDKTVRLWRVFDGAEVATLTKHTGRVNSVAFSPDGKLLASGSRDTTVNLWSVPDRSLKYAIPKHFKTVSCVAFSAGWRVLASGSEDGTILLWQY